MYQATIIYENFDETHSLIDQISKVICTHLPTIKIDVFASTEHSFYRYPSTKVGRPSSLFIIFFSRESFVKDNIKLLKELMWSAHEQKILIIFFDRINNNLLEYAWRNYFVEVAYLQIVGKLTNVNHFPNVVIDTMLGQYSPFIGKHEETNCSGRQIKWFPDKMKDLHGYTLDIGILNDPPFSNVIRNSTGHILHKSGAEVEILKFYSKALNFKVNFTTANPDIGGLEKNDPKKLIGFVGALQRHEMTMIANHIPRRLIEEQFSLLEHPQPLVIDQFCSTVPVIPVKSWKTPCYAFATLVGIPCIIIFLIFAKLQGFDHRFWTFFNIVSGFLGVSINAEPTKLTEIITFFTLIIASSMYSTCLWNELEQNALNIETEVKFYDMNYMVKWLQPMGDTLTSPDNGKYEYMDDYGVLKNVTIIHWDTKTK